jgi:putative ABC transport system substrate-binding protein
MPDRHQIEQRGRDREAGEADKHNGDHGVPNEGNVATQGGYNIFACHHGLTLRKRSPQDYGFVPASNHPANNFYVKFWVRCSISAHTCHDYTFPAPTRGKTRGGDVCVLSLGGTWRAGIMTSGMEIDMRRREFVGLVGGAAALWPFAALAQPAKSYRIAYLALLPGERATLAKVFVQRLQELGYSTGKNMVFDYRSADGRPERLPDLAAELVRTKPDIMVAGFGTIAAKTAAAATSRIPIVFSAVGDPLGAGLVTNLSRPGANVTGISAQAADLSGKRLQLIDDLVPGKKPFAVLGNPDTPYTALAVEQVKTAAATKDQAVAFFEARAPDQLPGVIDAMVRSGAATLLVLEDPMLVGARQQLTDLVAKARLPAIYLLREFVDAGGLMSYGPDVDAMVRRAAEYVDKILKGAAPADLPVEQPTKFSLVINMKTAKALGIEMPASLLALADEVLE